MAASDLQVSLVGTVGNIVTVSVTNPQSHAETARVRVRVTLVSGDPQTVTSTNFTVVASDTRTLQLVAAGTIATITDGPDPIEPL